MFELYIKYLLEGIAVAVAAYFIPRKKVEVSEIIFIALSAAATFAVLDIFAPKVGDGARKGAGFGIGANTVGWPMGGAENFDDGSDSESDDGSDDGSSEQEHFYQGALPAKPAMNKPEPTEKECIERIKNLKEKVEDSKNKVKKASGTKRDMLMKKIQELEMRIKKLEEKLEKMGSAKKADAKKEHFGPTDMLSSAVSTMTGSSDCKSADTKSTVTSGSDSTSADTKSAKSADTKSTETKSKDSGDMMSMDSTGSAVVGFSQGITQYANF